MVPVEANNCIWVRIQCFILVPRFRLLTVLNLWLNGTKKLPCSLTNLHNLQYLGIRSTLIEELPKELGNLQKLQTLDAKLSMVQRLPSRIAKLRSLRHVGDKSNLAMHKLILTTRKRLTTCITDLALQFESN